jgi:hypothetical protein
VDRNSLPAGSTSSAGFSARTNAATKLVASRTLTDTGAWQNSTLLGGDLTGEVRRLFTGPAGDLRLVSAEQSGAAALLRYERAGR